MAETAARVSSIITRRLCTVKQFCKPDQWPSESALRAIISDASLGKNKFQPAFKRIGRRVLVDQETFWNIVFGAQEA